MECKFCESKMKNIWSGGDGYHEPREEEWICPNCHSRYEWTEGCGGYWENNKGEEILDD